MKVSELIKWLTTDFAADEEIILSMWRRDLFTMPNAEADNPDELPDLETWADAVEAVEDRGWGDYLDTQLYDTVQETIDEIRERRSKSAPTDGGDVS